jgi:hypothetical protein
MNAKSPALSKDALVGAAARKAKTVQGQLHEAEAELHSANETLVNAVPTRNQKEIDAALQHNVVAKEKVHDAAEELEVVQELLHDADASAPVAGSTPSSSGQSGQGLKSLMPHLARKSAATP